MVSLLKFSAFCHPVSYPFYTGLLLSLFPLPHAPASVLAEHAAHHASLSLLRSPWVFSSCICQTAPFSSKLTSKELLRMTFVRRSSTASDCLERINPGPLSLPMALCSWSVQVSHDFMVFSLDLMAASSSVRLLKCDLGARNVGSTRMSGPVLFHSPGNSF